MKTAGNVGITEIPEAFPFNARNVPEKAFQTHLETPVKRRFSRFRETFSGRKGLFTVSRFQKKPLLILGIYWILT